MAVAVPDAVSIPILVLCFALTAFAFGQVCVSPATGDAAKDLQYRFVNLVTSFLLFIFSIFTTLHFHSSSNSLFVVIVVLLRSGTGIMLSIGALMFVTKTFETLFKKNMNRETPRLLQLSFVGVTLMHALCLFIAVIASFATSDQYYLEIYYSFVSLYSALMGFLICYGLFDVLLHLYKTRKNLKQTSPFDVEMQEKPGNSSELGVNDKSNDKNSSSNADKKDPSSPSITRSTAEAVDNTMKRLIILCALALAFMIFVLWSFFDRIMHLESIDLYSPLFTPTSYLTLILFYGLALSTFIGWSYTLCKCERDDAYTICYLCCLGSDAGVQDGLFMHQHDGESSHDQPAKPVAMEATVTAFETRGGGRDVTVTAADGLVLKRSAQSRLPVKMAIVQMEVLFCDVTLFETAVQDRQFDFEHVSYKELLHDFGGEAFRRTLCEKLELWTERCVFFLYHKDLTNTDITVIVERLQLSQYFKGNCDHIFPEMTASQKRRYAQPRFLGIDSKFRRSEENQFELRSLHNIILVDFVKHLNIMHDQILYIDSDHSVIESLKSINLCKTMEIPAKRRVVNPQRSRIPNVAIPEESSKTMSGDKKATANANRTDDAPHLLFSSKVFNLLDKNIMRK